MLNALIAWSLNRRVVVLASALLVLLLGSITASRLPVDVFPDLTAPTVTVLAEARGMAPEEIEALVAFPIETAVNGATGVRRVRTSIAQGIAVVWVEFDWDVEIFRARQIVAEKLQTVAAALPNGVSPPVLAPVSSVMGEIMMVGLSWADSLPPSPTAAMELRTVADWTLRRRLLAQPGVAQVVPLGGEVKQYQVLADPRRMQAAGVSLADVLRAAEGANKNAAGGVYMDRGQEIVIRGVARAHSVSDIAATVVAVRAGVPVTLGDVATVRVGPAPRYGEASVNARPGVVLAVQKQPGANTLELTRRIDAELEAIRPTLPPGMTLETRLFRQADFITVAIRNVLHALRDGAVLVVIILALFLANARAVGISVLAIPLSLVVALLAMQALGISINTMSLGGMAIAIGALVDDAIIDVENVFRRLRENTARPEATRRGVLDVVFDASVEIRSSIVNATLVIIVAFLPLFFLGGVEGRLLRPLGVAYVVSILASLVVAVTVTPVLCAWWLPQDRSAASHDSRLVTWLKARYVLLLETTLRHPRRTIAAALLALLATLATVPALGTAFLPEFNEGALTVSVVTVPGTSLDEASAIGMRVERILLADPDIRTTDRRQGRAELDEHAQGVNAAELDVTLREGVDKDALYERLRREFSAIPGTNVTIGQPIGHRVDHMLSGTRANIAVKIFGPDLQGLRRVGGEVRDAMQGVAGIADLQLEQQADVPQLRLDADRMALAQAGLTPGDFAAAVDIAFNGAVASQVLEEGRSVDLVLRLPDADRSSASAIAAVAIATPTGQRVPLGQLARVSMARGPNNISRENVQRKIVVQANVAGRDLGSAVAEVRERVAASVKLPPGYFIEYGGQFEAQAQSVRTLGALSLLAIGAIFVILYGEFRSARLATLTMANLPLALIGGVAAVLLTGGVVSIASLVGFVTLFGIATRNGILLVTHYRHLEAEGVDLEEAVRRGSLERLSPILMTALTAGLALIPLALGGGEPGKELQTPMAIVILGGLLSATALNMLVLPALYRLVVSRTRSPAGGSMRRFAVMLVALVASSATLGAQDAARPLDRAELERILERSASVQAGGVLRFGMPRSDLDVRVGDVAVRPNFALGSWVAFLPTAHGALAMGDLVVLESELGSVLRTLQAHGIEQSAIHHHLVGEQPSVLYVHVHAHGDATRIAAGVRAAVAETGTPAAGATGNAQPLRAALDSAAIASALGRAAPVNGGVMQFGIPRAELLRTGATALPPTMGLAHVVNVQPTAPGRAAVTGDFVLLAAEVNPVIRVLLEHGITPTSLHNHLLEDEPRLFFLHFWAEADAVALARGLRAALGVTAGGGR